MKIKLNQQQRNKIIIGIFLLMSIIVLVIFLTAKNDKVAIQRKLKGIWNIELDSTIAYDRGLNCCVPMNDDSFLCDIIIEIKSENIIELPCGKGNTKENTGYCKIISTKPDSIFFDVPKNPLRGKYAVKFYRGKTILDRFGYKMKLSNDSTLLICSKGSTIFNDDARNWEN